jgi:hypothetical protein
MPESFLKDIIGAVLVLTQILFNDSLRLLAYSFYLNNALFIFFNHNTQTELYLAEMLKKTSNNFLRLSHYVKIKKRVASRNVPSGPFKMCLLILNGTLRYFCFSNDYFKVGKFKIVNGNYFF